MRNSMGSLLIIFLALITGSVLPLAALAEGFIDDSHLSTKIRGIYFDRNFYENETNNRNMAAVGVELNYLSGLYKNALGIGVSGYQIQELYTSGRKANDFTSLDSNGDIDSVQSQIGQVFVIFQVGDRFEARAGRQKVKTMFIASSGTRSIPSTFNGVELKGKIGRVDIYGLWVNKWSRRHDDKFEDFATQAGGKIDFVSAIGARYQYDNINIEFETLNVKDYLRKYGLRASYRVNLENSSLTFGGGVYTSEDAGDLFVAGAESDMDYELDGTESNDSQGYNFDVDWRKDELGLGLSFTTIRGDMWIEDNYSGDHGNNPFSTRAVIYPDFTAKNEQVWQVRASYDWSAVIPGLTIKFAYNYGSGAENTADKALGTADEWYRLMDLKWKIPYVDNLSFRWYSQDYVSRKNGAVNVVKADTWENRVYLDYVYRF
jgi:outer membrane porin, OprD family